MKKQITFIFFVFYIFTCYSQFTFKNIYKDPLRQIPGNSIETSNGDIIFTIITLVPEESKIMKLNNMGETIDSIIVSNIPNSINTLFKFNDDFFFACSYLKENDKYFFCLQKYNYNFQLQRKLFFPISGYSNLMFNPIIVNEKDNLVIAFPSDSLVNLSYANLLEVNSDCEIIKYKRFIVSYFVNYINEIIQKDSLYYVFVGGRLNNKAFDCSVHKLDTAFNIINVYDLPPSIIRDQNNAKWINDSMIFLSGRIFNLTTRFFETKIIKIKVDTCLHFIKDTVFSEVDSNSYIGWEKNMDFVDVNNIFLGSFVTKDNGDYFSHNKSKIVLCKLDSALHLKWKKEYGGDANYVLISIKAAQDGGCIMTGARYDYLTQNNETDPFIIKVNSEGNLLWIHNLPDDFMKLTIYPNPGTDNLIVSNPPQNTSLVLLNLNGQKLLKQSLNQSNTVNTACLESGLYFYQIIDNTGKVISKGKWVKADR